MQGPINGDGFLYLCYFDFWPNILYKIAAGKSMEIVNKIMCDDCGRDFELFNVRVTEKIKDKPMASILYVKVLCQECINKIKHNGDKAE